MELGSGGILTTRIHFAERLQSKATRMYMKRKGKFKDAWLSIQISSVKAMGNLTIIKQDSSGYYKPKNISLQNLSHSFNKIATQWTR